MNKYNSLLKLIDLAVIGIDEEINKVQTGFEAVDGLRQLEFIRYKLEEIKSIINNDKLIDVIRSKPGMARLVIDTWPHNNSLGERICEIEYQYERLK